jgi:hypothetical protein
MNKKYLKDFLILAGIIILAAIGARVLAGGETLSDYAKRNPGKAGVESTTETSASDEKELSEEATAEKTTEATAPAKTDKSASEDKTSTNITTSNTNTTGSQLNTSATSDNKSQKETTTTEETGSLSSSTPESSSASSTTDTASDSSSTAQEAPEEPSPERVTYMEGFYYEPISNIVFKRISGISYPVDCTVPLDELRYVVLQYIDFTGESQSGEMICNKALAQDIVEIFYELYQSGYQIESIKLVDEYNGDDTASMLANNTSCFNYRVVEGTTRLSNHAYGRAIDLNPFYNPYITYNKDGTVNISPKESEAYADRTASFPYKIDEDDLACRLFKQHGFKWGGNWNNSKDYQHFEKK